MKKLVLFLLVVLPVAAIACTAAQKQEVKTAADVAVEACEVAMKDSDLGKYRTVDELCHDADIIAPFVTNILGAQRVAAQLIKAKSDESGADASTAPAP